MPGRQSFQKQPIWGVSIISKATVIKKLRETGIREVKSQKVFLDKIFGIPEKMDGIVDVENKTEVNE